MFLIAGDGGKIISGRRVSAKERFAISETGTGFAYAKLSGSQKPFPTARVARFVRMTQKRDAAGVANECEQPNP
jgi:hypothetical protein